MQIKELIKKIEEKFPQEIQESWDNSGLQIGDVNEDVKNILLCLDVTNEAIEQAIENNCNLIISHHPLIFEGLKRIDTGFKGEKIIKAIKNDICIYSIHTPADQLGLNTYIFNTIGFESEGKIVEIEYNGYGDYSKNNYKLEDIIKNIKENLNIDTLIYYGNDIKPNRVGLVTGSGISFIDDVIEKDIDLLITGDIKHHDAVDSVEKGVNILDIGHEGSEKEFVNYFKDILKDLITEDIKIFRNYNDSKYLPKYL